MADNISGAANGDESAKPKESKSNVQRRKKKLPPAQEALEEFNAHVSNLLSQESVQKPKKVFVSITKDCETGHLVPKPRKKYDRKSRPRKVHLDEPSSRIDTSGTSSYLEFSCDDPHASETVVEDQHVQEFVNLLSDLEKGYSHHTRHGSREWTKRKRALDENWADVRANLHMWTLMKACIPCTGSKCDNCMNDAVIRCTSCRRILCAICDDEMHIKQPFHDREIWINGFFEGISNRQTITDGEVCVTERPIPVYLPRACPQCGEVSSLVFTCADSVITIVTTRGRFEFNDILYACQTCSYCENGVTQQNMVLSGYWPATPQIGVTYYSNDLFELWDALCSQSPGTSTTSFLKSLENISISAGRPSQVNATSFSKSFHEWKYGENLISSHMGDDFFICPVCVNKCQSIHIDGHRKTYRFKKVMRGNEQPLHSEKFIANDEEVKEHMKLVYAKMGNQNYNRDEGMCGSSFWHAARSKSTTSFSTMDETGLVVAGCRHVVALKAVNMFAGEQYGYALYLHRALSSKWNMQFVWQDIMCKYWPWLERLCEKMPELSQLLSNRKALSVMHAKGHSLDCQIVWGGLYQEEAALSTGESMEQFFSYLAKCGLTTKNMSAAARIDSLTEHTAFWNKRKIENMAYSLAKQYMKTKNKLALTERELEGLKCRSQYQITDMQIQLWETELRDNATESFQERTSKSIVNSLEEYFKLHSEIEAASSLQPFVANADEAGSIITGQEEIFQIAIRNRKDLERKRRKLSVLESELVASGYKTEDLLRDGKKLSAESTLKILRTRMVHIYLNMQHLQLEIARLADTSKKRTKIRRRLSQNSSLLNATTSRYNKVASLVQAPLLDPQDVVSGKFSWKKQDASLQSHFPEWQKKQLIDKFVILKRCREEISLCIEEMRSYCSYYKSRIISLENEVLDLEKKMKALEADGDIDGLISELMIDFPSNINKERFDRLLAEGALIPAMRGILCLKLSGISSARRQLLSGVDIFKNAVDSSSELFMYVTTESVGEEDEDDDEEDETVSEEANLATNCDVMDSVLLIS